MASSGVGPFSYYLLEGDLGLFTDLCLGVMVFHDHLLSMAPMVARIEPSQER